MGGGPGPLCTGGSIRVKIGRMGGVVPLQMDTGTNACQRKLKQPKRKPRPINHHAFIGAQMERIAHHVARAVEMRREKDIVRKSRIKLGRGELLGSTDSRVLTRCDYFNGYPAVALAPSLSRSEHPHLEGIQAERQPVTARIIGRPIGQRSHCPDLSDQKGLPRPTGHGI